MSKDFIRVAPYSALQTHSRFHLNLRSREGSYHSLILFRLSDGPGLARDSAPLLAHSDEEVDRGGNVKGERRQLYAMESACPHLGADMSHADIEEYDGGPVAVCPWHRYDFDLSTGESMSGLRACTYDVHLRGDAEEVWVEAPREGKDWSVVELRPVSEAFADPPPETAKLASALDGLSLSGAPKPVIDEPVTPLDDPPKTLIDWAVLILNTPDPSLKVARTRHAVHLFRTGQLSSIGHKSRNVRRPPDVPPRHEQYLRNVVDPAATARRRNKVGMLHALANIEQWAVDLAWDIIARFGPLYHDLPPAFFTDFTRMALDESKHFSLLCARLAVLAPDTPYGSLPVHAGLWDSARATFPSLRSRLAIIHLVHEARGLDVNPGTIEKFRRSGDKDSVESLEVIHADEVTHVTTGHRWFVWCCEKDGVDPVSTFREEVRKGFMGQIKGPFNAPARETAGMTPAFYEELRGEMTLEEWDVASKTVGATAEQALARGVDQGAKGSKGTIGYEL
ncbi:DUF455-domain-containing protein [Peniophora sp. CONT]|nr:DUF455-domain-containing protein [Peniophora sp. CONT]